jgi:hypothetical protein
LDKRYRLVVCRECLGFGIKLTTDEYIERLKYIIESSVNEKSPPQKPAVLQRASRETKRCQRCKGTGWIFNNTLGTHVIPDMTWKR